MKQKTGRKLLSFLLTLAMLVGLMPGMSLTAYAATSHGITINTAQHGTVTASVNGSAATSAEEGATVTLTANPDNGYRLKSISGTYKGNPQETKGLNRTKTINGTYFNLSATDAVGAGWSLKNNSTITITSKDSSVKIDKVDFNIQFKGSSFNLNNVSCSAGTKSLNGNTLSVSSINSTTVTLSSSANSAGTVRFNSVTIYGTGAVDTNLSISTTGDVNVRTFTMPADVQGDVTITPVFEEIPKYNVTLNGGANATTSGGNTTQTGVTGAMTTVTYTANSGFHFTEFANITNNGITATRTSDTAVTVSGTPTADASITIPDAVADAVAVTGVTLNPSAAQTIDVDGKVSFTATVAPDDATDKKVKWSVGGTDTGAVKLYSDEACTTEVGADATETLTVYAKGISAGSATVTATSNADSEKKASCDVTVNAAQTQTETLLTTITATAKEQASYSTANVATVSFSYTAGGSSAYRANWGWWGYGWSATVNAAEGYTITKCVFYDDANRKATDSEAPFVVETTEEDKTPQVNGTPILAYTSKGITKIEVYGYATPAPALDPVSYMAWNGTTLVEKTGDDACTDYTVVTADTTTFEDGKWYVMSNSVTVSSRITVTGTVNLILCDGATLTASKGITVNSGNTINIYAQIGGTGELNAGSDLNVASIGGGARYQSSGTVNIHGGKITATGGSNASGIGGALDGGNGEVNIYGGNVTARGKNYAAGIGGYSKKSGGTVNIYGGTVNASGSQYGTTGIGIGGTNPGNCVVHIYGGEVTATSEKAAAGIQGTVTIDGGTVTATGGVSDSISSFGEETYSSNGISGTVTINGGTVSATGGNVTGEITNFGGNIYACNGIGGTVTINGGTVTATGGSHTGNFENHRGTTVKEKGFGGSLTLGTGMYLYGGTSANPESNLSNYRAGAGDYTGDRYVYMTVNNVVPHIHSFTYTADGATVTATCGAEGCDLTSNPTLTIVAPTLTTYGQTGEGISEKATLDGLDAFNSATDLTVAASDIKYYGVEEYEIEGHTYKKQGDELAQVPTAAGEYVAGLTLSNVKTSETETGDVIARVWYTIAPASISSVTVTDITAPVATEALDTEAATSTANVTLGAVTWNPTTTPAAYATQYTANVIATAAANYAFADTVTATVNGQAATVTKNDGGTLTIAYTFEKTALTPVTITATDKKADWSADGIAIPVEGMFTITEGAGAATYTVTNGTGEGTYDAQTGKLTVTKCGTFTVKVSTAATDTYAAGAETTATLTVNKVDSTAATVTANTLIYTGSAQALVTVTGEATGGTMQYALGTKDAATEEYTTSIPTATNAGTYNVYFKVSGNNNYNDYEGSATVTISKKPVAANISADDKTYDGKTDATVSASVKPEDLVSGDSIEITGLTGNFIDANAGEDKKVTVDSSAKQISGTGSDNYEVSIPEETTASITHLITEVKEVPATCTETGKKQHWKDEEGTLYKDAEGKETATEAELVIPALEHDWNNPTYEWAEDNSTVTATRTCKNDASHIETETAKTTSKVTKDATETEEGETTYTATFKNPAFTEQTKTESIPKLEPEEEVTYSNTKGNGTQWTKGSTSTADFTFKRSKNDSETFSHFTGIQVDGKDVAASNYTAEAGSVIVKLKSAYLETLSVGEHTLTALFDDGNNASAKFTIAAKKASGNSNTTNSTTKKANTVSSTGAPKTGDTSNMLLWFTILCASVLVLFNVVTIRRRNTMGRRR